MTSICIGIHVHAEPERLRATLDALRINTGPPFALLLLPDGPDAPTRAALAQLADTPQIGGAAPLGPPACFNRLAAASDAEVLVLLESGALVGPGWLDYLLAALAADGRNGIAGPSTNRAWNEQGCFPRAGATLVEIAHTAGEAARLPAPAVRTLDPLYSLADFCYAVRREVVAAVGAADETYGLGPCWEMDYNIRAARAGWRGVWARQAYVYRPPFTARRRIEEEARFEASRRRYQDKFCGLRLRGESSDYRPHCSGDACAHFAPADLIQIRIPLQPLSEPQPVAHSPQPATSGPSLPGGGKGGSRLTGPALCAVPPLVSCIMPTRDRAEFVLQSIRYFQRQDYPERELIIVDDGSDGLAGRLPADERIRYLRAPAGQSIGAKRNRACEIARGEYIAHWDDDDWYAPGRLSAQVAPIHDQQAEISALKADIFFDLARWEFWRCTPELHRRLFVEDVHGGTLVFHRRIWEQYARYPDRSLAEDALFLRQATARGARLQRMPTGGLFVYLRHATNSWSFTCGRHLDPEGWQQVPEPTFPPDDRAFYAARSAAVLSGQANAPDTGEARLPLVSCIMPTYNRRGFIPLAVSYFLRQDYPERELIVVDDGDEPVDDLLPDDERIRYIRLRERQTVGAKRNAACQAARGSLIAHWDDDDWHAPRRLSYQVAALTEARAEICGLSTLLFYHTASGTAWRYSYTAPQRPWVAGATLCYTRSFWERNHFADINVGEDTRFLWSGPQGRLLTLPDSTFYIGIIHGQNISTRYTKGGFWHPYAAETIQAILGDDWPAYVTPAGALCIA